MINLVQNLSASVAENPEAARDLAYLADVIVIVWAVLLGLTCVITLRLLEKGTRHVGIWHVFWFSFIASLLCWAMSRFTPTNSAALVDRSPVVGTVVAFAINAGLLLNLKQSEWPVKRISALLISAALMTMSLVLLPPSLHVACLPRKLLLYQIGVLFFFFVACSLCSFIFAALTLRHRFFDVRDGTGETGGKDVGCSTTRREEELCSR